MNAECSSQSLIFQTCMSDMAAFPMNQAEQVQPPSMMEKQAKTLKPKSDKKLKVAESAAPEGSPAHTQPAQTIEGTFLLITPTFRFSF